MTTTTRKVSAAAVSRTLTTAGLTRSESSSTRIRGYRSASAGFYVESRMDGTVQVWWTGYGDDVIATERAKASEVLTAKGYAVEMLALPGLSVARPA